MKTTVRSPHRECKKMLRPCKKMLYPCKKMLRPCKKMLRPLQERAVLLQEISKLPARTPSGPAGSSCPGVRKVRITCKKFAGTCKKTPSRCTKTQQVTRKIAIFLSTAAQHRHPRLLPIYNWFREVRTVRVLGYKERFSDAMPIAAVAAAATAPREMVRLRDLMPVKRANEFNEN